MNYKLIISLVATTLILNKKVNTSKTINDYKVIRKINHNYSDFTQGLVIYENKLYQSTGLYSHSYLQHLDINTGNIIKYKKLENSLFGEGIAIWNSIIIMLTWKGKKGLLYNLNTFSLIKEFNYPNEIKEGWGITHNNENIIVSDGSSNLYFLNPSFLQKPIKPVVLYKISVTDNGIKINRLNELEYISKYNVILANRWQTSYIYVINPTSGNVIKKINMIGLCNSNPEGVLNGIAYDINKDLFYITGKKWYYTYICTIKLDINK